MKSKEIALGEQVKYVENEGVHYSSIEDQFTAMDTMKEFHERVQALGFQVFSKRGHKWDPQAYVKYSDRSGGHIKLESYFAGNNGSIRGEHRVAYDISGLELGVQKIMEQIGTKE